MSLRRAVFLDRDGVINRNVFYSDAGEWESPRRAQDVALVPGALEAMSALQGEGFLLFIVSNQPSYAKAKTTLEDLHAVHRAIDIQLRAASIELSDAFYCYHHPNGVIADYSGACPCRKPSPFFLLKARDAFGLEMAQSWMVGDRDTDIECGRAAGVRTIQVAADHPGAAAGLAQPDFVSESLQAAVAIICGRR